jgi:hypothetical protein
MEPSSPARLYASAVGALLLVLGVVGFFYGSSFGSPGALDHTLGALRTNGWSNVLWILLGALGLLTAGTLSRAYALGTGLLLTVLGVWGLTLDPSAAIVSHLPAAGADEALYLVLGILGLLAAIARSSIEVGREAPERTSPQFVREGASRPAPRKAAP